MSFGYLWQTLEQSTLWWLCATMFAFWLATLIYKRAHQFALLNPVLVSVTIMVGLLASTHTPYDLYFAKAQFIHFLLGPATVALAVPLMDQINILKSHIKAIILALVAGSLAGIATTIVLSWLLNIDMLMVLSLLPRSVTTPIALGVSEQIGGSFELTVVFVIITGVMGAAFGSLLLGKLFHKDPVATGFALGVTSHGIGTARAFEQSSQAGAFAGLGMGLNGTFVAIALPIIAWLYYG